MGEKIVLDIETQREFSEGVRLWNPKR